METRAYLSDGAYVEFRGWDFRVYGSDGTNDHDNVYLDPVGFIKLVKFAAGFLNNESLEMIEGIIKEKRAASG